MFKINKTNEYEKIKKRNQKDLICYCQYIILKHQLLKKPKIFNMILLIHNLKAPTVE